MLANKYKIYEMVQVDSYNKNNPKHAQTQIMKIV